MNIREKLMNIQSELKAPKGQRNSFGNYNYRSCEDILESVKPICKKYNCAIVVGDMLYPIGERIFIQARARILDNESEEEIDNQAFAELDMHKGMSRDQCTGTASSYARKYALNGLLAIDDTKDSDTDEIKKIESYNNGFLDKKLKETNNSKQASKKELKNEPSDNETITEGQVQALENLFIDKEDRKPKMLAYFKVNRLEELTFEQYIKAIEILGNKGE